MNEGNIWQATLRICRAIPLIVTAYVIGIVLFAELTNFVSVGSSFFVSQFILTVFLAIPAHILMLAPGEPKIAIAKTSASFARFALRTFVLGAACFIPVLGTVFFAGGYGVSQKGLQAISLAVGLLGFCIGFGIWGTTLPAVIVREDSSFATATRRGRKAFGYAFPRLLVAFGFLSVVQLFLPVGLLVGLSHFLRPIDDGTTLIGIIISALAALIGAFQVIMTAVILSRAFLVARVPTATFSPSTV